MKLLISVVLSLSTIFYHVTALASPKRASECSLAQIRDVDRSLDLALCMLGVEPLSRVAKTFHAKRAFRMIDVTGWGADAITVLECSEKEVAEMGMDPAGNGYLAILMSTNPRGTDKYSAIRTVRVLSDAEKDRVVSAMRPMPFTLLAEEVRTKRAQKLESTEGGRIVFESFVGKRLKTLSSLDAERPSSDIPTFIEASSAFLTLLQR